MLQKNYCKVELMKISNQQNTQRDHNAGLKKRCDMSSRERLQQLQRKLYLKAKQRGWLNYYDVPGISSTKIPRRKLNWYLRNRLYRYYNRKSQRKSRLYRQQAFQILVDKYGLIDPLYG
jgi:hypothetical protein